MHLFLCSAQEGLVSTALQQSLTLLPAQVWREELTHWRAAGERLMHNLQSTHVLIHATDVPAGCVGLPGHGLAVLASLSCVDHLFCKFLQFQSTCKAFGFAATKLCLALIMMSCWVLYM
jgi:hypothetical protein